MRQDHCISGSYFVIYIYSCLKLSIACFNHRYRYCGITGSFHFIHFLLAHTVFVPVNWGFPSGAAGVITAGRAVSWTRGMTRIRHVLCRTALWGALRITGEMTGPRAGDTGRSSDRSYRARSKRSLHHVSTTVVIAVRETAVVACSRACWKDGRRDLDWWVVLMRMESAAGRGAPCRVAPIWPGARLCTYSWTLFLHRPVRSEVSCWKSNWKINSTVVNFLFLAFNALSKPWTSQLNHFCFLRGDNMCTE